MTIDPVERVEEICRNRTRRQRDLSIAPLIGSIQSSSAKSHRKLGQFVDLWLDVLPDNLSAQTRVLGLRAGVVQVGVTNAAAKYEIDRRLRCGLFAELRKAYPGTLARIKLRLERVDDDDERP